MAEALWPWEGYGLPDRIYQVTYLECAGPYAYPAHRHSNQWELVYVSRGQFRHRVGQKVVVQAAGRFVLVRENDVHALAGEGFSFYNLAFPVTFWDGIGALLHPSESPAWNALRQAPEPCWVTVSTEDRPGFEESLDRLLHTYDPLAFLGFWTRVMARCLPAPDAPGPDVAPGGIAGGPTGVPGWLSEAVGRARAAGEVPDLTAFVRWCGFSPEHVARTVRKVWDKTPTQLLADLRLDRAVGLLVQTNRTVSAIGGTVGFPSLNYFHRCFLRRFGVSPGDYRRGRPRAHQN
jgi:AraC-like DNA-binding protein